ncbi:MAG: hypothetical protein BGO49_18005 [Planctomycetales bacterium 71-10]|nr:MAG: hypothetical protein BGO49_18005 [Planctomycetales bacterium 71-10]
MRRQGEARFGGPETVDETPHIEVEATFLTREQGGLARTPDLGAAGFYMPHLVVQPSEARSAVATASVPDEDYLGVKFVSGPTPIIAGEPGRFLLQLFYHPAVDYEPLEAGAAFTIREGGKVVGYGTVVRRL